MIYKILADSVVLIHFLWIIFLFLGALWGVKNKIVKIFHIVGLVYAFTIQLFDWYCPLTHLEILLRSNMNLLDLFRVVHHSLSRKNRVY